MLHRGFDLREHQPMVLAQLLDMPGLGKAIELGSQCLRFSANDAGGQGTRQGFPSARGTRSGTEPLSVCRRLSTRKRRYTIEGKNFGCHHSAFLWKKNTIKLEGSRNLAQHSGKSANASWRQLQSIRGVTSRIFGIMKAAGVVSLSPEGQARATIPANSS
jgi:hypothetical protein